MQFSDLDYTDVEAPPIVREQFEETLKIFTEQLYKNDYPLLCEIHDLFDNNDGKNHNCIGCNLAASVTITKKFLESYTTFDSIRDSYTMYFMLLYLLVERVETVFSIIDLHKGYRAKNFKTFNEIRKWANFIKHPKAFMLVHHPIYTYEGSARNALFQEQNPIVIGIDFIKTYYSNDDKNKELFLKLENKEKVLVLFPEVTTLTSNLCGEIQMFMHLLQNNEVYREILHEKGTYYDFFVEQYSQDEL